MGAIILPNEVFYYTPQKMRNCKTREKTVRPVLGLQTGPHGLIHCKVGRKKTMKSKVRADVCKKVDLLDQ
jgi:hypothetical protein